jgi:hypothetical protein
MTNTERQLVVTLIQSLKQQLHMLEKMINTTGASESTNAPQKQERISNLNYTSPEEDRLIEEVLAFDKQDKFMQDVIKQAQETADDGQY